MTDSLVSAAFAASVRPSAASVASDAETAISVKLRHIKLCADKPTWGPQTAVRVRVC